MQVHGEVVKGGERLCSVDASVVSVMRWCGGEESLKRRMIAVVE